MFRSLRFKLISTAIVVEVVMLSLLVWNSMRLMEQYLVHQMDYRIQELQPLLNASLAGPLLREDLVTMEEVIQQFKTEQVRYLAIYNAIGEEMMTTGTPQLRTRNASTASPTAGYRLKDGNVYLLSMPITLIGQPVGYLEVELDTHFIALAISTVRKQGFFIAVSEIGLSVLLLSILGIALTRHLKDLTCAAHSMAGGDLSVRIPVKTHDEVGEAAATFNRMADYISNNQRSLQESENRIRRLNEELEQRVVERTTQLEVTNEELQQIADALHKERDEQQALIGQLKDAHSQLLQSEKLASIGQLAAGVAHEINNPVGYINSNVGSLQEYIQDMFRVLDSYERLEDQMKNDQRLAEVRAIKDEVDIVYLRRDVIELIGESQEGVTRVRQIVQDLKDFSHVDEAEWQWADIHKGIDSTLNVARNEIKYKADVVKEYGVIPQVECMPSQLNQVFLNLLVNAAHAIDTHGTITIRTGTQDNDKIWVEIADTGEGIPGEVMNRIFEPFFTTKEIGKGTGLGLSLSYGIIEKHHGAIEVDSEVGKGTVFRISIPRVQHGEQEFSLTGSECDVR